MILKPGETLRRNRCRDSSFYLGTGIWCTIRHGRHCRTFMENNSSRYFSRKLLGGTETQTGHTLLGPMTVVSTLIAITTSMTGVLKCDGASLSRKLFTGWFYFMKIFFGFINIGSYIRNFPYPVISGFMSGVGLGQNYKYFPAGLGSPSSTFGVIRDIPHLFSGFNLAAIWDWRYDGINFLFISGNYKKQFQVHLLRL